MGYFTNMSAGGGLLDDCVVRFSNARFAMYNYQGKSVPAPGLIVDFESVDDTPIPDEQVEQFWACGSGKDWNPSADGKRLDSPSNKSGIVKSSNLGMLIESLIGAGLAEDVLVKAEADISALNGLTVHVKRQQVDRKMSNPKRDKDGQIILPTVLLVDEIVSVPGGKSAAKAGNGAKGAAAASTDPAAAVAADAIMAFIGDNGQYTKGDAAKVFKLIQADSAAKAHAVNAFKLLSKDEFLSTLPEPLVYAGGVVTLG
jgi:hypothetical protein